MDNPATLTYEKEDYRIICKLKKCNLKSVVEAAVFHFFPCTTLAEIILGLVLFLYKLRNRLSLNFGK